MIDKETPIIIGGTGGSGTRVVQTILEEAGIFMGKNLNGSKDAMDFEPFLDETINEVLQYTHKVNYQISDLPTHFAEKKVAQLRQIAEHFLKDSPNNAKGWGWKNPRSIYILPLICAVFPKLYFVHVIRDGRDMALSSNQNQLRKHYEALFAHEADKETPLASIELWSRINYEMALWGNENLRARYQYIRFEDLCTNASETIELLLSRLGIDPAKTVKELVNIVQIPASVGRFSTVSSTLQQELNKAGSGTLKLFAYL